MSEQLRHLWIVAPYARDRQACWQNMQMNETVYEVDCHHTLRGPYTGVGSLLRQLVPVVYQQHPEQVQKHAVEILSLAPELGAFLTTSQQTLTALAVPKERTRFYSRMRTLRLAHGIIDFLKGCISLDVYTHLSLYFENVQDADPLDQELLGTLLRRADPTTLTLVLGTPSNSLPDGLQKACQLYAEQRQLEPHAEIGGSQQAEIGVWQRWLAEQGQNWLGISEPLQELSELLVQHVPEGATFAEGMHNLVAHAPRDIQEQFAQAFIETDCTSDNILASVAYELLDAETRQNWHDVRAEKLEQQGEWSLHLGAIPYHRERGKAPTELGAKALQQALDYCIDMGYYEATVDLGYRGRAIIDWNSQLQYYWTFTTKCTTSLAALGRAEEAEQLYIEARSLTDRFALHMQAAYATAMLYTRHLPPEKRNHTVAKGWINEAIALSALWPDPKDRAFNTVFNRNGLALIEMHMGRPDESLRLVTEGLAHLAQELEPGEHQLHRSVLLYNRGQVYAGIGKLEEALADYTAVIEQDPYYSEYYFDRGNLYRKMGREEEALADYERAILYSPPYPEAYLNRANVRLVLGQEEEAFADYSYVLEIDPTNLDALINRSSMLLEQGDYAGARQDIEQGLGISADNAQLLCTLGLLEMAEEQLDKAYQALSAAIEHDSSLIAAWTNRAIVAFEQNKHAEAIDDLTHALALEENATVRYNRGIAYQAEGSWRAAIDDFSHALPLSEDEDAQDIFYRRGYCHLQLAENEQARQDFDAHLAYGPSPYAEEIDQLIHA